MQVFELNSGYRILDILLSPIMNILGGFKKPVQESHPWHMQIIPINSITNDRLVEVGNIDPDVRFSHNTPFGLYHMPIFGGLNKYVVIEVDNFKDHWHVGWCGVKIQLNKLKIYENRLKLLYGKGPYKVFAMDD